MYWCTIKKDTIIKTIVAFANNFIVPVDNFAVLEQRLLRKILRLALTTYRHFV